MIKSGCSPLSTMVAGKKASWPEVAVDPWWHEQESRTCGKSRIDWVEVGS